ncbi:GGDEF domain-containing protein [Aureimonas endophytica]|uniref:GGDEF domain-containing protein n=1 Tax=Aureimonas endophytica TaxID=2027858 RepID=A0A916ZST3_9HYPH|nr:bifunctional diguanylate cyclase/phosphodiesterase [Aureimonas endophytica]GGE11376.1 GGDEF domain-containing protein [Aureimonas endophytica]
MNEPEILALAFERTADCIAVIAADGGLLRLNAAAASAFAPAPGTRWVELWSGPCHAAAEAALAEARDGAEARLRTTRQGAGAAEEPWESLVLPIPGAGDGRVLALSRSGAAERRAALALDRSAGLNETLIKATSEIVWHLDTRTAVTERRGWAAFTGETDDPEAAEDWLNFLHPDDRAEAKRRTDAAMAGNAAFLIEYRLRHRSGEWRWVDDHAVPLLAEDGGVTDWVGLISDIHERRVAAEAVRASEERLRLAIEATGLATWDLDVATGMQTWSAELPAMLGLPPGTAPGHEAFLRHIHPEDRRRVDAEFAAVAAQGAGRISTFRLRLPSGEERWIEGRDRAIRDGEGRLQRHLGTLQDITRRKAAEHEIWRAAHTDGLTGIANRALFQIRQAEALAAARRQGGRLALILVDLDRFKGINDTYGHEAGDAVLREAAARLSRAAPPDATVARFGGDEFGIVLPLGGAARAEAVAEAALHALRRPIRHGGIEIEGSASIGFAEFPTHDPDPEALVRNADLALYAVKAAGRNGLAGFGPGLRGASTRRLTALQLARTLLERDDILPFYQPKLALDTMRVTGFEALLRWRDAAGTCHPPAALAEAFEDSDLALRIGERMLARLLADMTDWRRRGVEFGHVALNVGSPEFQRDRHGACLADRILGALAGAGLPAGTLQIEVTERVLLDESGALVEPPLRRLAGAGIAIALDDFGTGYASLAHLQRFPVSCLKIDRSFVCRLGSDRGSAAIVHAVAGLARSLGMAAVAEGVEAEDQVQALRLAGCGEGQGYLFARPMPAAEVPAFLERSASAMPAGERRSNR